MTPSPIDQALQLLVWFLALVEFILALYVFLLNTRHTANRHVGALLFIFAINNAGMGLLLSAQSIFQANWPTYLLAATTPVINVGLLLTSIALLTPDWLRGRWRWVWWPFYTLGALPPLLTIIDVAFGTGLWYTPLDPAVYSGGYAPIDAFTAGSLSVPIRVIGMRAISLITLLPLIYALRDRQASSSNRRLAGILLAVQVAAIIIQVGLRPFFPGLAITLVTISLFAFAYAYAAFQQMISERRAQRGRLQVRLTALILASTLPLLIAAVAFGTQRAATLIEQKVQEQLETTNRALAANVTIWLDLHIRSLQQLVILPDILSMDAARQTPLLEAMAVAYPHMYLVSTTDLDGMNVARNDGRPLLDYSDRTWFLEPRNGAPLAFQSLIGRTSGMPALVVSMPIQDAARNTVGVGMFASELSDIAEEVLVTRVGQSGFAYILDADNRVVAHPDPDYSAELRDLSDAPPVAALRQGHRGALNFVDEEGQHWRAYVEEIEYGWGVIVQQPEAELLADLAAQRSTATLTILIGAGLLLVLAWLTIRQTLMPIDILTETASAIASGDLTRKAPIESEDEIGTLARAFNSMTEQLRQLIDSLEQQVASRTHELEQRSASLAATAEVGRAAAAILDPDDLIRQAVDLVRERFGLYYVGLFMLDESGEWAELRAGTGSAGQAMLARSHRIRLGEGMIGWSVAHAEARVALEAGEDAIRLATPELPETRSEAALPLRSRGRVLGALSVQHTQAGAFDPDTISVLQTMADQVAVALDNARLFAESQELLDATRRAYGEYTREGWVALLQTHRSLSYRYEEQTVRQLTESEPPQTHSDTDLLSIQLPIIHRGQQLGTIVAHKRPDAATWSAEEVALMEALSEQLGTALEGASLYYDSQQRAAREQLVASVSSRVRATLDLETVLKTAAQELREAMGLPEMTIRLTPQSGDSAGRGAEATDTGDDHA